MTTDSSSSTNRFVLRRGFAFLIKYQNINFMYRHLFFSYYCTAVSFERVIHPNPLGFTLFFFLSLFLLFTSIIWRHWGWAVPFIFIRVVVATLFFGLEREAFRWRMSCDVCVCEGKLFSIKCRVIFNEMDKDPDDDDKKKTKQNFHVYFFVVSGDNTVSQFSFFCRRQSHPVRLLFLVFMARNAKNNHLYLCKFLNSHRLSEKAEKNVVKSLWMSCELEWNPRRNY